MYRETCWCSSSPQKNPLFPSLTVPTHFSWAKFHNFFMTFQGPSTSFFLVPFAWRFSNISNSNSVQTWFQVAGIFAEGGGMQRENVRDISKTSQSDMLEPRYIGSCRKLICCYVTLHGRSYTKDYGDNFNKISLTFSNLSIILTIYRTFSRPGKPDCEILLVSQVVHDLGNPVRYITNELMKRLQRPNLQHVQICNLKFFLKAWLKSIIFTFKWNVSVWGLNPALPVNRRSVEVKEPESQERVKVFSSLLLWMAAESDGAPA